MNGWVLIRNANAEKTEGGLIVPDSAKERYASTKAAVVVAVSEGYRTDEGTLLEPRVKVGDRIWLSGTSEVVTFPWDKEVALVHQQAIVCVFEELRN